MFVAFAAMVEPLDSLSIDNMYLVIRDRVLLTGNCCKYTAFAIILVLGYTAGHTAGHLVPMSMYATVNTSAQPPDAVGHVPFIKMLALSVPLQKYATLPLNAPLIAITKPSGGKYMRLKRHVKLWAQAAGPSLRPSGIQKTRFCLPKRQIDF
ncbi:hypothetical protein FPSE_03199 [Fusarium pseudograminearum CS3096]|uniref:Uncharacterized protein n=1 Tax=Fusarium pseudograminearum (strain CS3096) TaxID=1028729 RepID=K3VP29_FUSPC|nr:hypothetical protein FPSE_03199 [Fusarium pseudograminearum CS3096]EKJ76649.1 hypothetical protein FPSE_03199 [Fusarium pseudograminearum CS3096]